MSPSAQIPSALEKTLRASRSRIRRILAFRGVCTTLAVFVAAMLGIMAIDAMVTIFSSWIRWLLWSCGLALTATAAWMSLVRPLRRTFTLAEIAALIERNHPELEERLSTTVELAQSKDDASLFSPELIRAISEAATADAVKVSPNREFTSRTVKPRFLAAAGAFLVLLALFAAFPTATPRLVARALLPSAEVDNVYASSLHVAPGDKVVLEGASVEVNLAVESGFPTRAFVRTSVGGRRESVERMTRTTAENGEGPAYYTFVYPSVRESFDYRVNCGSALTRAYRIDVVPEPTYSDRRIVIAHPSYTGRPPDTYTNNAAVVGVAGSEVTISVRPSRADVTGAVVLSDGRRVPAVEKDGRLDFRFSLAKGTAGLWRGEVWDSNGFSNTVESASVEVVKDTPPVVKLVTPEEREIKLPRSGVLPLEIEAKDDFGISRRVIELCVGAGAWTDLKEMEGDADSLAIASLPLGNAAAFRVRVRVEDNRPQALEGPGVARSEEVLVEVQANGGKSLARQDLAEMIAETKKEGEDIRRHLERAKRSLGATKDLDRKDWALDNAKRSLRTATEELANGEGLLAEFIENLKDSRLETGAEIFTPVLENEVIPTHREAEDVYLRSSAKEQSEAGMKAEKSAQKMLEAFDEAMRRFDLLTKKAEARQALVDMAEREEALADAAEKGEMSAREIAMAEKELGEEFANRLKEEQRTNLEREKKWANELMKRVDDLAKKQEEIRGMSGDQQKGAERNLATELQRLASETGDLMRNVEKKSGTPETDANATSQPMHDAQKSERAAADNARQATEAMERGDGDEAKSDMNAVERSLAEAKAHLESAMEKMSAKESEFAANAEAMREVQQTLAEATQAAAEAAKEEAGQQQQGQQQAQQQGQQQMQQAMQKAAGAMKAMAQERMKNPARKELSQDLGADWFHMKSESASGAEADAYNDVPAEYRSLVRDYFRALNEGGKK